MSLCPAETDHLSGIRKLSGDWPVTPLVDTKEPIEDSKESNNRFVVFHGYLNRRMSLNRGIARYSSFHQSPCSFRVILNDLIEEGKHFLNGYGFSKHNHLRLVG